MTASGEYTPFAQATDRQALETGTIFAPRFDVNGLIACIAVDDRRGDVLMLAYMNAESLAKTLQTGYAHYWSRSRQELWKKGATSGQTQRVVSLSVDCDQDTILLRVQVDGDGGACHVGYRSCFFRALRRDADPDADGMKLEFITA